MATGTIPRGPASFGFPTAISIGSGKNLNDYTSTGFYSWGNAPTNAPNSRTNCVMLVIGFGAANAIQFVFARANDAAVQTRSYVNGTWSSWANVKVS